MKRSAAVATLEEDIAAAATLEEGILVYYVFI
jgi:hypothetical protein